MDDKPRKDIRRILKTFGIKADEMMVAHLARNPEVKAIQVRVTLVDLTDYGDAHIEGNLSFAIEDEVSRE